jgi:ABC-2 type transport system permease protein
MRYVKIFLLYFQSSFIYRSRIMVWFLISFLNPMMSLMFWIGAKTAGLSGLTSYYLLLTIASALLMSHTEEEIAEIYIQKGGLVNFLLKPFPFLIQNLLGELPWRVIQGSFGLMVFIGVSFLFHLQFSINVDIFWWISVALSGIFGYLIAYLFKIILAFSAFWLVEYRGLQQVSDVVTVIFTGTVMPIYLFPQMLQKITFCLPFPYMIYYPVLVWQGKFTGYELVIILGKQMLWIFGLFIIYKFLWQKGIRKFTGVGQ